MKRKIILSLLSILIIGISSIVLYSCQKTLNEYPIEQQNITDNSLKNISSRINGNNAVESASCACLPSYSMCSTTCLWSDCCVCCPPGGQCAAGCYFGIASCRCEEGGGGEKRGAISGKIRLKIESFEKFRKHLDSDLKIWSSTIDVAYQSLLKSPHKLMENYSYGGGISGTAFEFDQDEFNVFFDSYQEFIESLSIENQEYILKYISQI